MILWLTWKIWSLSQLLGHNFCLLLWQNWIGISYVFLWLRNRDFQWNEQKCIDKSKLKVLLAFLFDYNLDASLVYRFLSNNHTWKCRDIPKPIVKLALLVDATSIENYKKSMSIWYSNHFVAKTSSKNALLYYRQANHESIKRKLFQVIETMNKEEKKCNPSAQLNCTVCTSPTAHLKLSSGNSQKNNWLIIIVSYIYTLESRHINNRISTKYGTKLDC